MVTAHLRGRRPHLAVDEVLALRIANLAGASIKLVWRPSRASMSPLYPFWQVTCSVAVVFVDQQGRCWDQLQLGHG